MSVGDYVVIDCYRAIRPATITLTGTGTAVTTSNTITGTGTIFDQELLEGDVITLGGQELQVYQIISPTILTTIGPVASNVTNGVVGFDMASAPNININVPMISVVRL